MPLQALKAKQKDVEVHGLLVPLSQQLAVLGNIKATATPVDGLPDSLQQLLWPVIMVPDLTIVAEVALACAGFRTSKASQPSPLTHTCCQQSQGSLAVLCCNLSCLACCLLVVVADDCILRGINLSAAEPDIMCQS